MCAYEVSQKIAIATSIKKALIEGYTSAQRQHFAEHIAYLLSSNHYDDFSAKEISYAKSIRDMGKKRYDDFSNYAN